MLLKPGSRFRGQASMHFCILEVANDRIWAYLNTEVHAYLKNVNYMDH